MSPSHNPSPIHSLKIVGCGQKHFYSQKSGLSFPAFLIQFSYFAQEELLHYYHWRSKRDFLFLNREIMNQDNSRGSKSFPKNAFSKLCDQASLNPWLKPLIGELESERERVAIASAIECEISLLDVCSSAYQPRMRNSITRIEDFINKSTTGLSLFCRKQDSDNIRVVASNNDNQNLASAEEKRCSTAAKLGQYFTSQDIARKVRNTVKLFCFMNHTFLIGGIITQSAGCHRSNKLLSANHSSVDHPYTCFC
jgi:hypothetical protein